MTHITNFKTPKVKNGTAAGKRYMERVKALECCTCNAPPPSQAHHIRELCTGAGMKSSDFETIPLCFRCHAEFHDVLGREKWEAKYDFQRIYTERTQQKLKEK